MCKQKPGPVIPGPMGEETNNGFNLSFLSHANFVFSGGSFLLILAVVLTICFCRRGQCFRWVLGETSLQGQNQNQINTSNAQAAIPMQVFSQQPASASAPVTDQVEAEIEHLKRANQLLELQQRRSQLLTPGQPGDLVGSRVDLSSKYPVHYGS